MEVLDLLSESQMRTLLRRAARVVVDALEGRIPAHEPCPDAALAEHRGTFVTLRRSGALAGCIGYAEAPWPLWDTLTEAARSSALDDGRFDRIPVDALEEVELEVSVLSPPREISSEDFVPGRHGLFLELHRHRGLLLPQVAEEHGLDHDAFLDALCRKAGLAPGAWRDEECRLHAFEAQVLAAPLLRTLEGGS